MWWLLVVDIVISTHTWHIQGENYKVAICFLRISEVVGGRGRDGSLMVFHALPDGICSNFWNLLLLWRKKILMSKFNETSDLNETGSEPCPFSVYKKILIYKKNLTVVFREQFVFGHSNYNRAWCYICLIVRIEWFRISLYSSPELQSLNFCNPRPIHPQSIL